MSLGLGGEYGGDSDDSYELYREDDLSSVFLDDDFDVSLSDVLPASDFLFDEAEGAEALAEIGEDDELYAEEEETLDVLQETGPPFRWVRGDKLGSGAYAKVFMALDVDNGNLYAVKQQELGDVHDGKAEKLLEKYEKEIRVMRNLHHPNIVQYFGCSIENRVLNIFMEYVGGRSLKANLVKMGPFSESVVSVYAKQIAAGVAYLHRNGIIHRDIKCANILLGTGRGARPVLKLTDFGCSKQMIDNFSGEQTHSVTGTPYFMAPEIIRGDRYNKSADIWSFGCTLIEMLTGKPPLVDKFPDPTQAMFQIQKGVEIETPPNISLELRNLILACLRLRPAERPSAEMIYHNAFFTRTFSFENTESPTESTTFSPPPETSNEIPAALPPKVLQKIFSFLGFSDLERCAQVCRSWRDALNEAPFWARLLHENFNVMKEPFSAVDGRLLYKQYETECAQWRDKETLQFFQHRCHKSAVNKTLFVDTPFYPTGQCFMTCSDDRTMKLFSVGKIAAVRLYREHEGPVTSIDRVESTNSAGHTHVVSGSADGTVKLWEVAAARSVYTVPFDRPVAEVACGQHDVFVMSKESNFIHYFDLEKPVEPFSFFADTRTEGHYTKMHLDVGGHGLVAGSSYGMISFFDTREKNSIGTVRCLPRRVDGYVPVGINGLQMDMTNFVMYSNVLFGTHPDAPGDFSVMQRWDLRTMSCDRMCRMRGAPVSSLFFNESCVFTADVEGQIKQLDARDGTEQQCWTVDNWLYQELPASGKCPLLSIDGHRSLKDSAGYIAASGQDGLVYVLGSALGGQREIAVKKTIPQFVKDAALYLIASIKGT